MRNEPIMYLDNAATTNVLPEVIDAMLPYFDKAYGNPSSSYDFSVRSKTKVNECREIIAKSIGSKASEVFFTSGGSESDNWAIKGIADVNAGRHIITSKIEHHAVLNTCKYLEEKGFDVTYLDVDENGLVRPNVLKKAIRPDTFLISIMFANNEIGTIEPINELGKIAHEHNIIFHTDAVQAYGQIPIDVEKSNIDLLSASGHKLNGPKGIGFLYVRNGINIGRIIHGGGQESGRRAGTENVPSIVGFGKTCEIAMDTMEKRAEKEIILRDHMIDRILYEIPFSRLNGHRTKRLPNNVNISFQFLRGESMLVLLDMAGICAASGSACSSDLAEPSHVLTAIGLPGNIAYGSVRMTLGYKNTMNEIDYAVDKIKEFAHKLRAVSPEYEDYMNGMI